MGINIGPTSYRLAKRLNMTTPVRIELITGTVELSAQLQMLFLLRANLCMGSEGKQEGHEEQCYLLT